MNAEQMYNEFEIAYEAIASGDAPGYEPYEVSILLTEAQDSVIKELISTGIEFDDKKALVLGPKIATDSYNSFTTSSIYPNTYTFEVDQTPYWSIINEIVDYSPDDGIGGMKIDVRPIDHSFFAANINNPYKKPGLGRYVWRFIEKGTTNAKWLIYGIWELGIAISTYYINYLEKPTPIIVPGVDANVIIDGTTVDSTISSYGLSCSYNTIIHRDIIKTAAEMGKAFIGDAQGVQLLNRN